MLTIKNLTVHLNKQKALFIENLTLKQGQSLLVVGDNASGKSTLAQVLSGQTTVFTGELNIPKNIACLSFELEAQTLAFDRDHDNSEFIEGGVDVGRTSTQIITENIDLALPKNRVHFQHIIELLAIAPLMQTPFKFLSTGETRKILMAKALMQRPDIIILDEPYAGLDIVSQRALSDLINQLISQQVSIILFDFYHPALPESMHTMLWLADGEVKLQGARKQLIKSEQWQALNEHNVSLPHYLPSCVSYQQMDKNVPFVELNNVSVSFFEKSVFKALSWQFKEGQHWQIIGPNGCGKSTLLAMISGDSTKAYGQDLWLFGKKRGSGETIWDIKKHYGVVSASLQRDYRVNTSLLETLISGFFDSIGIYQQVEKQQINTAQQWLVLLGLADKAKQPFQQLSYGEQRLALIIRAVIKLPLILILDEPCQGLDNANRARVLALIDYIAEHSRTHILLVSHDVRDKLNCLTHRLTFTMSDGSYTALSSAI